MRSSSSWVLIWLCGHAARLAQKGAGPPSRGRGRFRGRAQFVFGPAGPASLSAPMAGRSELGGWPRLCRPGTGRVVATAADFIIPLSPATRIYLASGATDLRKSFEGLSDLVAPQFREDPLSGHLYVFANRRKNRDQVALFRRQRGLGLRQAPDGPGPLCLAQNGRAGGLAHLGRGVDLVAQRH